MRDMRWKDAQRHFQYVLIATVLVCLLVSVFWEKQHRGPPDHVLHHNFITARCSDGRRLGNLMFNYASMIGIARRYNMTPIMPYDFPLFDVFELSAKRSSDVQNTFALRRTYEEYGKRACAYDIKTEQFETPIRISYELVGYFQSWKYFSHIYPDIRKEFEFKYDIRAEAGLFFAEITFKGKTGYQMESVIKVGIHVRRGDILEEKYSNYGYSTPDMNYYIKAMAYFYKNYPNEDMIFIVCSDDIEWAKNNIQGANIFHSHSHNAFVDLAILSLCDHVIMSVGSFGWWAAWFVNGTTLYYGDWPRPVSKLEYMVTKRDYFLPNWIPIYDKG